MTLHPEPRIGEFLSRKLNIPWTQFKKLLNMQQYLNDKMGEIALMENLVLKDELKEILTFQEKHRTHFGSAAISLGILKSSHVKYILDLQARRKNRIGELLIKQKIVSEENFFKILEEFYSKKHIRFTILSYARASVQNDIRRIIKPYHYLLHICRKEEDLFPLLKNTSPQLLLLDQEHPGDALRLSLEINRSFSPRTFKIAILTSWEKKLEIIRGYEYGIDYILPSSFDPKHLINIMIDAESCVTEKRKERILVVDDSPIVRQSIGEELEENGFQTLFAENGKEAVEIASLERPELITMDINMPVMDGYEACLQLKKNSLTSHIPIIIVTTNNTRGEREKGFEVGAVEYFTKPFPKGHLSNYIKVLFESNKKKRRESILIAEDSPICRNIYNAILSKYGFNLEMAENGKEVFELLEKGIEPSLILLDCVMPVMDGIETCRTLRQSEKFAQIPVIMVTTSKNKEDILRGLRAGANDYITKPFDGDELIARIEAHVNNFNLLKKIQKQNRDLSDLNRMKDEYLSIVSHDLRSPLTNILGFAEILELSPSLTEKEMEFAQIIKSCAKHQLIMVNELLALRSLEKIQPTLNLSDFSLQTVMEDSLKFCRFNSDLKKIQITQDIPKAPIIVRGDRSKILQVFNNLFSNAIKFSHEKSSIAVKIALEKDQAVVSVRDEGIGIPEKDRKKIFSRHGKKLIRRGTREEPGTGLGLPIVKNILKIHKGKIWVENGVPTGSVFYFSLPLDAVNK